MFRRCRQGVVPESACVRKGILRALKQPCRRQELEVFPIGGKVLFKLSIEFESHFHGASAVREPAPVAEAAHEEQAAAATLLQMIGTRGVRNFHRIEAWSFIRYPDGQRVFPAAQGNGYMFGAVALVSVQHGVGDSLGQAD